MDAGELGVATIIVSSLPDECTGPILHRRVWHTWELDCLVTDVTLCEIS
jgi:hypothetical protein